MLKQTSCILEYGKKKPNIVGSPSLCIALINLIGCTTNKYNKAFEELSPPISMWSRFNEIYAINAIYSIEYKHERF